jgi:hypothetical protein
VNREQFIVAEKFHQKRAPILFSVPLLLIVVATAAYAPYMTKLQDHFDTKFAWAVSAVLAIAPIAVPTFASLLIVIAIFRRIERKLGLACPHCHKSVIGFGSIVIATRNCPFCGLQVLDENHKSYA